MTPPRSSPVRLGVAYYPEQWPEERWAGAREFLHALEQV